MSHPRKILIVDDEARIRSIINRRLREAGLHSVEAGDGESALSALRQDKDINLVILDILLPGASGVEVFEEVKKQFPGKKVLVSSVYPKDEQGFLIANADEYFYKSEELSLLVEKVNRLLDNNTGGDEDE